MQKHLDIVSVLAMYGSAGMLTIRHAPEAGTVRAEKYSTTGTQLRTVSRIKNSEVCNLLSLNGNTAAALVMEVQVAYSGLCNKPMCWMSYFI